MFPRAKNPIENLFVQKRPWIISRIVIFCKRKYFYHKYTVYWSIHTIFLFRVSYFKCLEFAIQSRKSFVNSEWHSQQQETRNSEWCGSASGVGAKNQKCGYFSILEWVVEAGGFWRTFL